MYSLLIGARIRLSGDIGGYFIVIAFTLLVTYFITWLLELVSKKLLSKKETGKKVISIIQVILWIAAIVLIILDITNVAPLIRNIIFMLLGE